MRKLDLDSEVTFLSIQMRGGFKGCIADRILVDKEGGFSVLMFGNGAFDAFNF